MLGHADRIGPLRDYCTGLILPGERKSVEPMAARTAPARTAAQHQHQPLLHFVGVAPWSDEKVLAKVREMVLPSMQRHGPIEAWIIDDTGFPKRVRTKILPENQTIFRDIAPVLARQFILLPSPSGKEAISLITTHVRHSDLDRETFQRRWLNEHADLVLTQPDTRRLVQRYVQLHNIGPTVEGVPFFHPETSRIDGVTLMGFASMNDVEEFLQTDGYLTSIESERALSIPDAGEYWTALNFGIVNRIHAEKATRWT